MEEISITDAITIVKKLILKVRSAKENCFLIVEEDKEQIDNFQVKILPK